MCQHCCRMEWTPCAPIPYACPLCPVRQVADLCDGSGRGEGRRRRLYRKSVKRADNQTCRGISELYSHVVAAKRSVRNVKRSGRKSLRARTADSRLQKQGVQFQLDHSQYIDNNIPVPYREPVTDPNWTWASRYSDDKVLAVQARMDTGAPPTARLSPVAVPAGIFPPSPYN